MKFSLLSLTIIISFMGCKKSAGMVEERSLKPSMFKFISTKSQTPYLVIQNVGDVEVRGSMPDETTITIEKYAKASSRKRAAALIDAIAFKPTLAKDGKIRIAPTYPKIKGDEKIATNVRTLIPLNMDFPVTIASRGGKVDVRGITSTVSLKVAGTSSVSFRVFKGAVTGSVESGVVRIGDKIHSANLTMKRGTLSLVQRNKNPGGDITLTMGEGDVTLQLIKGLNMKFEIIAPAIENKASSIKLTGGKGGSGPHTLKVVVTKGKVLLQPELF